MFLVILFIYLILFIRNHYKKQSKILQAVDPRFPKDPRVPVQPVPTEGQTTNKRSTGISIHDTLLPFKEEAQAEWRGLLKMLHIYDYEKEEKNLKEYRKLRGWDK